MYSFEFVNAHYKKKCIQINKIQQAGLFRKSNVSAFALLAFRFITWKERDFAEKFKNLDTDLKIILLGTIKIIT